MHFSHFAHILNDVLVRDFVIEDLSLLIPVILSSLSIIHSYLLVKCFHSIANSIFENMNDSMWQ